MLFQLLLECAADYPGCHTIDTLYRMTIDEYKPLPTIHERKARFRISLAYNNLVPFQRLMPAAYVTFHS